MRLITQLVVLNGIHKVVQDWRGSLVRGATEMMLAQIQYCCINFFFSAASYIKNSIGYLSQVSAPITLVVFLLLIGDKQCPSRFIDPSQRASRLALRGQYGRFGD